MARPLTVQWFLCLVRFYRYRFSVHYMGLTRRTQLDVHMQLFAFDNQLHRLSVQLTIFTCLIKTVGFNCSLYCA